MNVHGENQYYHKGCGTMGVPVFASENIELTFAFNFKKYQKYQKNIVYDTNYMRLRHQKHGSWIGNIF